MGTTTKMAIPYPEATGLVKDGWEDMKDIADQVDAKSGLVLLNSTSFTSVSSQAITPVFSSSFDNYRIILRLTDIGTDGVIYIKLRNGATDSSADYNVQGYYIITSTLTAENLTSQTTGFVTCSADAAIDGGFYSAQMELYDPFNTIVTGCINNYKGFTQAGAHLIGSYAGYHNTTNSYDGFNIIFAGATTGKVWVYGYNK